MRLINKHSTVFLFLLGVTALAGACTSDATVTQPTRADYDDMAQSLTGVVAAQGGGGEVAAMGDVVVIGSGGLPSGFSLDSSGSITGTHLGVDYSYDVTCYDVDGNTLATCGSTTDHVDATVHWAGTLTLPQLDASVQRDGSWSIDGLRSAQADLSGNGAFKLSTELRNLTTGAVRDYDLSYNAVYNGVLIDTSSHEAVGGAISYTLTADRMVSGTQHDVDAHFEMDAVITFTGDGHATLVIDGDQQYQLDTRTGVVVRI